jgi:hypothetical protein
VIIYGILSVVKHLTEIKKKQVFCVGGKYNAQQHAVVQGLKYGAGWLRPITKL